MGTLSSVLKPKIQMGVIEPHFRIFHCVDNDDVEGLKLLLDYPNMFQIKDKFGDNVLHRAIIKDSREVFKFLLTLEGCPIHARNKKGETVLQVAINNTVLLKRHFIYSLIEKGVNIDCNLKKNVLFHYALDDNRFDIAKLLLEKGADIKSYDYFVRKPLRTMHETMARMNTNEMLGMMLYFGGDPSIPNRDGYRVIDIAFRNGFFSKSMQEHLVFYFFDDYSTGYDYDIPFDNLFHLLQSDPPFAPQVLKYITSVNLVHINYSKVLYSYFRTLFMIKPEYLKWLIEKFDYVIEAILDAFLKTEMNHWPPMTKNFAQNFDLFFHSQFEANIMEIIDKIRIHVMVKSHYGYKFITFLLSYGADIYDYDLDVIFDCLGDREFFRILLHMDIKISDKNRKPNVMCSLLYNVHMDIETFLNDPDKYECSQKTLKRLLTYYALPKLQNYCQCRSKSSRAKLLFLPTVPFLVELARNEARKFLVRKYKIENSMQFYTLIKRLPISKVIEKIITLETKLYESYN